MALVLLLERNSSAPNRRRDLAFMGLDGLYTVGFLSLAGQTPGQIAMGIRVVDHDSGLTPTLKQISTRWLVSSLPTLGLRLLSHCSSASTQELPGLKTEIDGLRREHHGDRPALNEKLMTLYARSGVTPSKWLVVPGATLAVEGLLGVIALRDPLLRALPDQLAKTVIVNSN